MFDIFINYLQDKVTLTAQDIELIKSVCTIKKLRKRQYLLQEGDVCKHVAFVCKGFLRYYSVDAKGQEHIMQFAPENYWTGDRESSEKGSPSKYNIDALEDSEVVLITKSDFDMLIKTLPAFRDLTNIILGRNVAMLHERILGNIAETAEEKYNNYIKKFPHIVNRVPLHMIASYLGISAETISRIRSQATKK